MKLWMVLTIAGKIAGTWGPLPYDMDECHVRRDETQAEVQMWIDTGKGVRGNTVPDELRESFKTWKMSCVEAITRPKLGRMAWQTK